MNMQNYILSALCAVLFYLGIVGYIITFVMYCWHSPNTLYVFISSSILFGASTAIATSYE